LLPAVHSSVASLLKLGVVVDRQIDGPCWVHYCYGAAAWWFQAKPPRYEDDKGEMERKISHVPDKKIVGLRDTKTWEHNKNEKVTK
jgi:hypothetical protein